MATYTVRLTTYAGETVAEYRHRTPGAAYRRLRAIINGKARGVDKIARQRADWFQIRDDQTGVAYALNPFARIYL